MLRILRWILVLPAAVAIVPFVDGLVVAALGRLGAVDRGLGWVVGKAAGHFVMGAAAVIVGASIAPSRRVGVALVLTALAALVSLASVLSGSLPLPIVLPLAVALVTGAAVAAATVHRDAGPSDDRATAGRHAR
jgi:peptidoglycan/LPS O-acetylase OafA/YrhL